MAYDFGRGALGLILLLIAWLVLPLAAKPEFLPIRDYLVHPYASPAGPSLIHVFIDDARSNMEGEPSRGGDQRPAPIVILDIPQIIPGAAADGEIIVRVTPALNEEVTVDSIQIGTSAGRNSLDPPVLGELSFGPPENCESSNGATREENFLWESSNSNTPEVGGLVQRLEPEGPHSAIEIRCTVPIQTLALRNGQAQLIVPGINAVSIDATSPIPVAISVGKSAQQTLINAWRSPSEVSTTSFLWGPSYSGDGGGWDGLSITVSDVDRESKYALQLMLSGALLGLGGTLLLDVRAPLFHSRRDRIPRADESSS